MGRAVHGDDCEENEDGDQDDPEAEHGERCDLARGRQDEYCSAGGEAAGAAPTAVEFWSLGSPALTGWVNVRRNSGAKSTSTYMLASASLFDFEQI
jgi:hypothetical protein